MLNTRLTPIFVCVSSILVAFTKANVNIVARTQWHSSQPKGEMTQLNLPVSRIIICHTAGYRCSSYHSCLDQIQGLQKFHMRTMGFDDIAYNFLVDTNGNVYEGRGWNHQGAIARGYNAGSLGISFIGNFQEIEPSENSLQAVKSLLEMGVQMGLITHNYRVYGHRQLSHTLSPGDQLFGVIQQWHHWSGTV